MKHFSKSFLSVLLVLLLAAAALTGCTNAEAPKSSGRRILRHHRSKSRPACGDGRG